MNKLRLAFRTMLFVSITLTLASLTQAQNIRSFVSGLGDDANVCSRTSPCKTFTGALSKTNEGGEIDALDTAGFGVVTITKSITIDGTGTVASILASATSGITINITSSRDSERSVRLRGLSINGVGSGVNGIDVVAALKVSIEDCVIDGFAGNGIDVRAGTVFVRNTTIRNNGGASITVANVSGASAGLSNVALVFNAFAPAGAIEKFDNVVIFGKFPKPPQHPPVP
jgi:hypothetical protein